MYLMCTHTVAIVMSSDTPDPEPDDEYFISNDKLCDQKVQIIPGEKKGSEWLIVNERFILNKNRTFKNGNIVWECRSRRRFKCPFRMETEVEDDSGAGVKIMWMYDNNVHTCVVDPHAILVHKFKTEIKTVMANDFRAKYSVVYNTTKKKLLDSIVDPDERQLLAFELPSIVSFIISNVDIYVYNFTYVHLSAIMPFSQYA